MAAGWLAGGGYAALETRGGGKLYDMVSKHLLALLSISWPLVRNLRASITATTLTVYEKDLCPYVSRRCSKSQPLTSTTCIVSALTAASGTTERQQKAMRRVRFAVVDEINMRLRLNRISSMR